MSLGKCLGDLYCQFRWLRLAQADTAQSRCAEQSKPRLVPRRQVDRIPFQSRREARCAPAYSGTDIYLMDTEGSSITRLTETLPGRLTQNPAWSPDGKMITFNSTRDGDSIITDWEIYVMN